MKRADVKRHFTATAFVVHDGRTLLHWHRSLGQWVPPGGHLDEDEDPVAGVLREVQEETGLEVELLALTPTFDFRYPRQLSPPYTILLEDSHEEGGPHQHIDLIYFSRPRGGEAEHPLPEENSWTWVTSEQLARNEPIVRADGTPVAVADDVRALGLAAIEAAGQHAR